jgi:malonate decarboxylase epsilon subunit
MSVAFIFPCQGSQYPGMLSQLPESSVKNHFLNLASEFIGYDVCKLESENALATTEATQIALFVAGVIGAQTLRKGGVRPAFVAGHSIGAFAAAVASGSLPFEMGLQIVAYRASLLHSAFPSGYGMGAIAGLEESTVTRLLGEIPARHRKVYVASVNAKNQIFVTGLSEQIDFVLRSARKHSARKAERLRIAVPSHCCLLRNVAKKLRRSFSSIRLNNPRIPYVASRNGKILLTGAAIWRDLIENVEHPVRWCDVARTMIDARVSLFLEMPPGRMLTDIGTTSFPEVRSLAVDNANIGETSPVPGNRYVRFTTTGQGWIEPVDINQNLGYAAGW